MGLSLEEAQIQTKTAQGSYLELRLLKISGERQLKHVQGSAQTSEITSQMQAELDAVKAKYGDEPSSEEYRQYMAECESIENGYTLQLEVVRDQMTTAEDRLDTQQEVVETRLEVINAEIEQWKEARDNKVENTCAYFQ